MSRRQTLVIFSLITLVSCSNKLSLESQDKMKVKESYFEEWTAGVRGGGSGLNIYIILEDDYDIESKSIDLQGIYFQNKYCELKKASKNKYQGFIKTKGNTQTIEPNLNDQKDPKKEEATEVDAPFKLDKDEAVIRFTEKGKTKYYKLNLQRKELTSLPM